MLTKEEKHVNVSSVYCLENDAVDIISLLEIVIWAKQRAKAKNMYHFYPVVDSSENIRIFIQYATKIPAFTTTKKYKN